MCTCEILLWIPACYTWLVCTEREVLVKYAGRAFHVTWVQWEFYLFAFLMRWWASWLSLLAFLTSHVLHCKASTNICWRKECGNEWMLHKVPILVWLMIVSCFLVSVFYFTVLSQNTASLSFRNYSEELQKGRPLWKCVTNRWCSEDLEICTSLRWHTVRSSSLQAFWTTFFQILEDFH